MRSDLREDDSDLDKLLGDTFAKVGESPSFLAQTEKLQAMLDAAKTDPPPLVDPSSLRVRFSRLKLMGVSAAHYFHACQQPDTEETLAMRLGAGVHGLLLGKPRDVVLFDGHRAGKNWDRFSKRHQGATILNAREWNEAMTVVRAVRRNKHAHELLLGSVAREELIEWSRGDRACRSTPDIRGNKYLVDLKTARSSDPRWFNRESFNRHYHAQTAFYEEAIEERFGTRPDEVYLITVETSAPNPVTVFRIPDELRELGTSTWSKWFEHLLVCEASDSWPEYTQAIVDLEAPFALEGLSD